MQKLSERNGRNIAKALNCKGKTIRGEEHEQKPPRNGKTYAKKVHWKKSCTKQT